MSEINKDFYDKKKSSTFFIALSFLLFVWLLSGWLYYYNMQTQKKIDNLTTKKQNIENSIAEIESDENVQIYSLYERHKGLFEKFGKQSTIPLFISHLKKNFAKYRISWENFSYSDGIVSVDITSKTDDSSWAYEKIIAFLDGYSEDEKALFSLDPVNSFSWYDTIKFSQTFNLK